MAHIEKIAALAHEVNRIYCMSLGDMSQPLWVDAPEWQKRSARSGVMFHLLNKDAGPAGSHENWLKDKAAEGWKYGPVKDPDLKEHPCFVPYAELPLEQRMKDHFFVAVVKGFRA